jgi:ribose 1,5-bisphosphokinase
MQGSVCCSAKSSRTRGGCVALVVGPSGAGKDAIIGAVREQLAEDPRFLFPKRIVTRPASRAEANDTVSSEEFEVLVRRGALALHWHAHGLRYGLPVAVEYALSEGCVVVFNASRRVVASARARYNCAVLYVDAPLHLRAQRLATRSRERAEDIATRLERVVAEFDARQADLVIDNSGSLAAAAGRLELWLQNLAYQTSPENFG